MDFGAESGSLGSGHNAGMWSSIRQNEIPDVLLIWAVFWIFCFLPSREENQKKPTSGVVAGDETAGIEFGAELEWRNNRIASQSCAGSNSMASRPNPSGSQNGVTDCVSGL